MKVIFLDVDGVLNNAATTELTPTKFLGVSDNLIEIFRTIVDETDAKVVLTSTWKYDTNAQDLNYLYDKLGEKYKPIAVTKDPRGELDFRGVGIKSYLSEHEVEEYVIIDDFEFDFEKEGLLEHFVWTQELDGLTETDARKAIDILKGKLNTEEEIDKIKAGIHVWGYHK